MNSLQTFNHSKFGDIRAFAIDGKPWFIARDVATALGYEDTINAIKSHCRKTKKIRGGDLPPTEKSTFIPLNQRGSNQFNIIPESDLYRLIMRSNLPSAEYFQDWVVEEVLPAIRRTGTYTAPRMDSFIINTVELAKQINVPHATFFEQATNILVQFDKPIGDTMFRYRSNNSYDLSAKGAILMLSGQGRGWRLILRRADFIDAFLAAYVKDPIPYLPPVEGRALHNALDMNGKLMRKLDNEARRFNKLADEYEALAKTTNRYECALRELGDCIRAAEAAEPADGWVNL